MTLRKGVSSLEVGFIPALSSASFWRASMCPGVLVSPSMLHDTHTVSTHSTDGAVQSRALVSLKSISPIPMYDAGMPSYCASRDQHWGRGHAHADSHLYRHGEGNRTDRPRSEPWHRY